MAIDHAGRIAVPRIPISITGRHVAAGPRPLVRTIAAIAIAIVAISVVAIWAVRVVAVSAHSTIAPIRVVTIAHPKAK